MNEELKLKFSGVKDLTVARYAAAAMAEWVGFDLNPSSDKYINPLNAKTIIDWLSGPKIVGEFGDQEVAYINEVSDMLGLDMVELHASFKPELLEQLERPYILRLDDFELNWDWAGKAAWVISNTVMEGNCICRCKDFSDLEVERILSGKPKAIEIVGVNEEEKGISNLEPVTEFLEKLGRI